MQRTLAVLTVALVVASLGAVGLAGAQTQVTLTVTVVDANGTPVSDVKISADWQGGGPANATTRANGQALVDVAEGATVRISVHDDRYVRNTPYVVEDASTGEVRVPVTRAGSIDLEVVGPNGPVGNAVVQLYHDGTFVVNRKTAPDGTLRTGDIERGTYTATVWKSGFLKNQTTITVDGDESRTIRLERGSRLVTVTVRDDHFSPPRPVPNATVQIAGSTVTTLSNGEASVQVPVNDNYEVTVSKDGYRTNTTTISVGESRKSANLTIQRTPSLSISPANDRVVVGETVRVEVTDEYDDPVSGATVSVDGESVARTDASGVAAVPIESAGSHELTASTKGLTASTTVEGVEPGAGPTATPTMTLVGTPTATETPSPTTTTSANSPGFTVLAALVAILAAGLVARRR